VEFVAAQGKHVDWSGFNVDLHLARRLHRVGVEYGSCFAAYCRRFGDREHRAGLIVRPHDRNDRTVRAFQNCDAIKETVIVTRKDLQLSVEDLTRGCDKVRAVVEGGKSRDESVRNGLNALSDKVKLVAIHDGARPLITGSLIDRTVRAAHSYHAAAPGIPVKDTIKIVCDGTVQETPDRSLLSAIQTPQIFTRDLLMRALQEARKDNAAITDDCSAVERLGVPVKIVDGDERNIKVTTPMDLKIATLLLEETE
jgi:2-C-methyl-D-erythritol 4-phosphate cytidylyltransferase